MQLNYKTYEKYNHLFSLGFKCGTAYPDQTKPIHTYILDENPNFLLVSLWRRKRWALQAAWHQALGAEVSLYILLFSQFSFRFGLLAVMSFVFWDLFLFCCGLISWDEEVDLVFSSAVEQPLCRFQGIHVPIPYRIFLSFLGIVGICLITPQEMNQLNCNPMKQHGSVRFGYQNPNFILLVYCISRAK